VDEGEDKEEDDEGINAKPPYHQEAEATTIASKKHPVLGREDHEGTYIAQHTIPSKRTIQQE